MDVSHLNRPPNATSGAVTVYQSCGDLNAVLIWYLVLQSINMFLGVPANLMVLWLIHKNKGDSSTSDIFIFHLAVLDILFCLIFPLELANIVFLTTSTAGYVLRFFYGMKDTSPLLLSCICLDRYVAVLHPITFTRLKDRQHRTILALVAWLLIFAYSAAKCALGGVVNFDKIFIGIILAAFFLMVFCNTAILIALRQSRQGRDAMHPVKKRAFKLVLVILVIIVFNYSPPVALFPFEDFFSPDVFRCYIHNIAFGLMNLSSSIQPVLYLSKEKMTRVTDCCQIRVTHPQQEANVSDRIPIPSITSTTHIE
ncbi:proteinase-activated receptor 3 [Betta splendens]|uniref:Proteinase-activated receptor 3 n=1 Tax=Betta splendens TaxID=158456 RepID=A0A9W2Y5U8_BETSP|nr:proteinase-activated receptor 3 [Betta splendens]